jgi:predicted NBD/HSP70 family sugar kinase
MSSLKVFNGFFVKTHGKLIGGFLKSTTTNLAKGNNLDDLRKFNLAAVLRIVHHERSISRSELSARTALNRSTISALIGELATKGLVYETDKTVGKKVGRPSTVVQANENTIAIAVNPEIDAVNVGVIGLGGHVHKQSRFETNGSPTVSETIKITNAIIDGLTSVSKENLQIVGIGLAIPELIRKDDGFIQTSHHLDWKDVPIAQIMEEATGFRTRAANEAYLSTLAEQIFGSGNGINDLVFMNGGPSGIGGGIITGGRLVSGFQGFAGELGHTAIKVDGEADSANVRRTVEAEVSRNRLLSLLDLKSADFNELDQALRISKSPAVLAEVSRQLEYLALAISNLINLLNPELIILGGFLGSIYSMDTKRIQNIVAKNTLKPSYETVRISRAALGVNQVVLGAGELIFQRLLDDPIGIKIGRLKNTN